MSKALPRMRKQAQTKVTVQRRAVKLNDPTKTPAFEALERVKRIYISEGYRKRTVRDYERYFEQFIDTVKKAYMEDIVEEDFREYLTVLLEEKKLSPVTVNIRLTSIRAVFNRMHKENIISENPITNIRKVKEDEQKIKLLTENQVRRLFSVVDKETYVGFRDYCMMLTALKCGLRGDEIRRLEVQDIDFDNEVILLPGAKNKNRKNRPVPLHRKVRESLQQLIEETREYLGDNVKLVFLSQFGNQMSYNGFRKRLKRYAEISGLKKECQSSPHCLRHTFAVNFLNSPYGNIRALQKILGHSHLSTTEVYLDYADRSVIDQFRKVEEYDTLDV